MHGQILGRRKEEKGESKASGMACQEVKTGDVLELERKATSDCWTAGDDGRRTGNTGQGYAGRQ
jgi:hypothetical protein